MKATGSMLKILRGLMKSVSDGPLHAYIIPSCDAHQSEYLAECDKRRDYISGFTGSLGTAVVTETAAALWTDGRYFLQAGQEMDNNWTLMKEGVQSTLSIEAWLIKNLPSGSKVGVDPHLISYSAWTPLKKQLNSAGHVLVSVSQNLIDDVWTDRPTRPKSLLEVLPLKYTGKTCKAKVEEVRAKMKEQGASLLVVTALDEVAWLLNLRGSDIEYNPVFFSYVAITPDHVHLFVDDNQVTAAVVAHFKAEDLAVTILPYEKALEHIAGVVHGVKDMVWISHSSSYAFHSLVPDSQRITQLTPIALMKAIKNETELQGMINCHIRDGAALCCYFAWLEKNVDKQVISEVDGAKKLESFRSVMDDFVGLSFATISSSGPNGAIIHYHPQVGSDRTITSQELYLCDSGGQYRDGTTDVTRTLHLGVPTEYEKECFTRVLKGHILLATSVFPTGVKGNTLDTLARKYLWDVGLNYLHGTGHGIGHYLNVHEGPMGISWRVYPDDPGLSAGMLLSNEPGYYEDGKFGIRIENIVRIVPADTPYNHKDVGFLTFDTITLVPIQKKMLLPSLLTEKEIDFINSYHAECKKKVGAVLKEIGAKEGLEWLNRETEPIG